MCDPAPVPLPQPVGASCLEDPRWPRSCAQLPINSLTFPRNTWTGRDGLKCPDPLLVLKKQFLLTSIGACNHRRLGYRCRAGVPVLDSLASPTDLTSTLTQRYIERISCQPPGF